MVHNPVALAAGFYPNHTNPNVPGCNSSRPLKCSGAFLENPTQQCPEIKWETLRGFKIKLCIKTKHMKVLRNGGSA